MDDAQARARLTQLWLAYQPAVVGYLRRRLPPSEVDDALSETFLVCWRRIEEVPRHERPWLLTIARNVAATRLRTNQRWETLQARVGAVPHVAHGADELAVNRLQLRDAWSRLPEPDRELLALVAWDGLSQQEAAQVLGLRRSAFSMRLSRARKNLAALLAHPNSTRPALSQPPVAAPAPQTTSFARTETEPPQ